MTPDKSPDRINYEALAARVRTVEKWIDTVSSPLWKRLIWWGEGFYFLKVGRWYARSWTPKWPKGKGE